MPGKASIEHNQYYAHPRNFFWFFMGEICGFKPELSYGERIFQLKRSGIALWDVLKHCERDGSLDTDIIEASEVPNDFRSFLKGHPSIRVICFNGNKAEKAFHKHVLNGLTGRVNLTLLPLPSTSPANTTMSKYDKLEKWGVIEKYLVRNQGNTL